MHGVSIRGAEPGDADLLGRIAIEAYGKYAGRMPIPPAPVLYDYREVVGAGDTWVLLAGGAVGGMVTLVVQPDHLLFRNLAVRPAFQGRGLGRAALAFAETQALQAGMGEVRLWTNVHMTENLPFYRRAGYLETHRGASGGHTLIHMAKRLAMPGRASAGILAEAEDA